MAAFTVQQGKRYRATISLGVLKRLASNASLADRLEAAGFTEVSVTSSGRTRIAGVEVLRGGSPRGRKPLRRGRLAWAHRPLDHKRLSEVPRR